MDPNHVPWVVDDPPSTNQATQWLSINGYHEETTEEEEENESM